ncbi:hypothetical protein DFQ26_002918, partial [Actinomortierella ambigua]
DLNSALMNPTWIPGEHMEAYCKRIETLYKASGSEPFELRLIRVIHNQLPQNGRDKVLERFKTLEDVKDPLILLDFLREHPNIFNGPTVDNGHWHRERLGEDSTP